VLLASALVLGVLAAAAPSPAEEPPATAEEGLTIYHWWISPSESSAINALIGAFNKEYPAVTVLSATTPGGGGVKIFPIVQRLMVAGQPPDAFQMNGGYPAQPFFDAGLLSRMDDVWASEKLEEVVPSFIQDVSKFDGHYYAVPVNVHRMNVVWYNKALLDKYKIDPNTLTTWDAFFKAAQTLRAGGIRNPIQVGQAWTLSIALESMMASLGMPAYEDWFNGKIRAADDARLLGAFGLLRKYLLYANEDHHDLEWDRAIQRVIKGESAFCLMGDWANGEFRFAGLKYGKDYGSFPAPGTKGLYGVNVDVFLRPRGSAEHSNSDRWLKVVVSRDGQDAFNLLKGSIPARNDVDVGRYDPYQRSAIADFKTAKAFYPSSGVGTPVAFKHRYDEIIAEFAARPDATKAAADLGKATIAAAPKFTRVWSLKGTR
jgi:glucose/mannose transport system substrate-binding protein